MRRRILISALPLVILAGCTENEKSGDETADAANAGDRPLPSRVKIGDAIDLFGDGLTGSMVVSDTRVIEPPEGWSTRQVVVTVGIELTTGQMPYSETSFRLVSPVGERTTANTVASDVGLPGKALGFGTLVAPTTARGLVTFDAPATIAGGWVIEFPDPAGRATFVWEVH